MKKDLMLLLLLLFFSCPGFAQCDSSYLWSQASAIFDLHLFDTLNMIAVGDNGTIIRTTDGGEHWAQPLNYRTSGSNLRSLHFPTPQTGYAVGYASLLKSEDGGASWFNLVPPYWDLRKIHFLDDSRGFIAAGSGYLYSTINGGRSWTRYQNFYTETITTVGSMPNKTSFIAGNERFMARSSDEGKTWSKIDLSFLPFGTSITCIEFFNNSIGYAGASSGRMLKTIDGGTTWTLLSNTLGDYIWDIHLQSQDTALAVANYVSGTIFKTVNGGASWQLVFTAPTYNSILHTVASDAHRKKIVVAGSGGKQALGYAGRKIISTTDLGTSWQVHSENYGKNFWDIQFFNDSTGLVTGEEGMTYETVDRGLSWRALPNRPRYAVNYALHFLDEQNGFLLNDSLYRTSNGGNSWTKLTRPYAGSSLQPYLKFIDTSRGFISEGDFLFKTYDGGITWQTVLSYTGSFSLKSGVWINKNKCFVVGYNGYAVQSSDTGSTWTPIPLNTTSLLAGVYFYNDSIGFIGGDGTFIYKTINGGSSWTPINVGMDGRDKRFFHFLSDSVGYMISHNNGGVSEVYGTNNGGQGWFLIQQITDNVNGLSGGKTLYIAGNSGLLYKTEVLPPPVIPGYIAGYDTACINNPAAYLVANVPGTSYQWSLSGGGTHAPDANKDTVQWTGAGSYLLSVTPINYCGTAPARVQPITVIDYKPKITRVGDTLTAENGTQYKWLLNGAALYQTAQSLVVKTPGNYSVIVTNSFGCRDTSEVYAFWYTGVGTVNTGKQVQLFPSPASERIYVGLETPWVGILHLQVLNSQGQLVISETRVKRSKELSTSIGIQQLPPGVYYLLVNGKDLQAAKTFIVGR